MAGASPLLGAASASLTPKVAISEPATENNAQPTKAIWYGNSVALSSAAIAGSNPMVAMTVAATATPTADPTWRVAL